MKKEKKDLPTREEYFAKQRQERGFDDSELWDLFYHHALWLLPRLKEFRRGNPCHPMHMTKEEWDSILDEMIDGFEIIASDVIGVPTRKIYRALNLFKKYYFGLWW